MLVETSVAHVGVGEVFLVAGQSNSANYGEEKQVLKSGLAASFDTLVSRQKRFGPHGFRAVLWHQGESDANQKNPTRTLPGSLYQEHLGRIIRDSRQAAGWDAPWFVAQVSYHVPGDEASADIREAQSSLWKTGLALQGPDSDALKGELRERGGKGVHFSGIGLRAHAASWTEKITPWLERELGQK
jgi:hypothetical protein